MITRVVSLPSLALFGLIAGVAAAQPTKTTSASITLVEWVLDPETVSFFTERSLTAIPLLPQNGRRFVLDIPPRYREERQRCTREYGEQWSAFANAQRISPVSPSDQSLAEFNRSRKPSAFCAGFEARLSPKLRFKFNAANADRAFISSVTVKTLHAQSLMGGGGVSTGAQTNDTAVFSAEKGSSRIHLLLQTLVFERGWAVLYLRLVPDAPGPRRFQLELTFEGQVASQPASVTTEPFWIEM